MATVTSATTTLNFCMLDGCMIQDPSVFINEVTFKAVLEPSPGSLFLQASSQVWLAV